MNLNSLDLILIAGYFLGLVGFGVLVRRIRGFSDFAVGSRAVPFSMIFASLSAAYIGPAGRSCCTSSKAISIGS